MRVRVCVCVTSSMRKRTQNVLQKICRQATTLPQLKALDTLATQCQELSTEIAFDEVPQIAYWTSWTWEIPPGQNICDKNYLKKSYKDLTHYQPVFHQCSRNSTTISSITTYWTPTPGWGSALDSEALTNLQRKKAPAFSNMKPSSFPDQYFEGK